jgi:predicted secreted protein
MKILIYSIFQGNGGVLIVAMIMTLISIQTGYGMAGKRDISSTHILSGKDSGREITVQAGDILEIRLEGTGGTGYSWHLNKLDGQYLLLSDAETSDTSEEKTGGPVMNIWRLKTLNKGVTEIRLDYFREWEGIQSAIRHFSLKLLIQN